MLPKNILIKEKILIFIYLGIFTVLLALSFPAMLLKFQLFLVAQSASTLTLNSWLSFAIQVYMLISYLFLLVGSIMLFSRTNVRLETGRRFIVIGAYMTFLAGWALISVTNSIKNYLETGKSSLSKKEILGYFIVLFLIVLLPTALNTVISRRAAQNTYKNVYSSIQNSGIKSSLTVDDVQIILTGSTKFIANNSTTLKGLSPQDQWKTITDFINVSSGKRYTAYQVNAVVISYQNIKK